MHASGKNDIGDLAKLGTWHVMSWPEETTTIRIKCWHRASNGCWWILENVGHLRDAVTADDDDDGCDDSNTYGYDDKVGMLLYMVPTTPSLLTAEAYHYKSHWSWCWPCGMKMTMRTKNNMMGVIVSGFGYDFGGEDGCEFDLGWDGNDDVSGDMTMNWRWKDWGTL